MTQKNYIARITTNEDLMLVENKYGKNFEEFIELILLDPEFVVETKDLNKNWKEYTIRYNSISTIN